MCDHPDLIFQQDGAFVYTASYTNWWTSIHNIPILDLPPQSPDLNLIEHLWDYLDHKIRKRIPASSSENDLIRVIQEEWASIKLETLHELILSLPNRVDATIKAKGRHTHY